VQSLIAQDSHVCLSIHCEVQYASEPKINFQQHFISEGLVT